MIDHPLARGARWVLSVLCWLVLSFKLDPHAASGAEQAGYAVGSLLLPLLIAVAVRGGYVALRRRAGKRLLSPWLFYLAGFIGFVARLGELSHNGS
jgi:hypothetical protein